MQTITVAAQHSRRLRSRRRERPAWARAIDRALLASGRAL